MLSKDEMHEAMSVSSCVQVALPAADCRSPAVGAVHLAEHLPLLHPNPRRKSLLIGKNTVVRVKIDSSGC